MKCGPSAIKHWTSPFNTIAKCRKGQIYLLSYILSTFLDVYYNSKKLRITAHQVKNARLPKMYCIKCRGLLVVLAHKDLRTNLWKKIFNKTNIQKLCAQYLVINEWRVTKNSFKILPFLATQDSTTLTVMRVSKTLLDGHGELLHHSLTGWSNAGLRYASQAHIVITRAIPALCKSREVSSKTEFRSCFPNIEWYVLQLFSPLLSQGSQQVKETHKTIQTENLIWFRSILDLLEVVWTHIYTASII